MKNRARFLGEETFPQVMSPAERELYELRCEQRNLRANIRLILEGKFAFSLDGNDFLQDAKAKMEALQEEKAWSDIRDRERNLRMATALELGEYSEVRQNTEPLFEKQKLIRQRIRSLEKKIREQD